MYRTIFFVVSFSYVPVLFFFQSLQKCIMWHSPRCTVIQMWSLVSNASPTPALLSSCYILLKEYSYISCFPRPVVLSHHELKLEKALRKSKAPPGRYLDFQSRDHWILEIQKPIDGTLEPSHLLTVFELGLLASNYIWNTHTTLIFYGHVTSSGTCS